MRVLLADDEPIALARLQAALASVPEAELCATARNGREALELIRGLRPDVAVLDIEMPGRDAFAVLEGLRPSDAAPEIIFATAYDAYAIKAFDLNAIDYLLKPVSVDRFRTALNRVKVRIDARSHDERFTTLQAALVQVKEARAANGPTYENGFWVRERKGSFRLDASVVERVEAEGDYVRLHAGGASYLISDAISRLQGALDPAEFARIHRSTIINLNHIMGMRRRAPRGLAIVLSGGVTRAIGAKYAESLLRQVQVRRWRSAGD